MKLPLKIFIACFLAVSSYAQEPLDTDGLNNINNVFLYSLKEYCKTLDSATTNTVYVIKEHFIGESWPRQIGSFEIEYLADRKEYKKAIKKHGGSLTIIGIGPLNFRNERFYVSVITFGATYSKRITHLVNGGGWSMYFNYDPEKKGLVFENKQL